MASRLVVCSAVCSLLLAHVTAFTPASPPALRSDLGQRDGCDSPRRRLGLSVPLCGLQAQMDKIETSAVQRMTKGYDKLCKNCPTRLQPRVDTLTEVCTDLNRETSTLPTLNQSKRDLRSPIQRVSGCCCVLYFYAAADCACLQLCFACERMHVCVSSERCMLLALRLAYTNAFLVSTKCIHKQNPALRLPAAFM
jgi:hypothetical protein